MTIMIGGSAQGTQEIHARDADGDPLTYSATSLPPGLSINAATGLIPRCWNFKSTAFLKPCGALPGPGHEFCWRIFCALESPPGIPLGAGGIDFCPSI